MLISFRSTSTGAKWFPVDPDGNDGTTNGQMPPATQGKQFQSADYKSSRKPNAVPVRSRNTRSCQSVIA